MAMLKMASIVLALVGYGGIGRAALSGAALAAISSRKHPHGAGGRRASPEAEEVVLDTPTASGSSSGMCRRRATSRWSSISTATAARCATASIASATLTADGTGLVALSYRGYGGSTGSPTETGLLADAAAAYAFAAARYPPERIVLWGESLGTGVAVALAAEKPVGRVILQSPFTSTADIAAARYWFVPVRLLMKDQFRSDLRIGKVTAPVLVMHGDRDGVVPFAFGEQLYAMIKSPKTFVRFPGAGHLDLSAHGANEKAKEFIAAPLPQ